MEDKVLVLKKLKDTKGTTYNTVGNDQIVLRYADILLIYAEALNEIKYSNSQTLDATNALNLVYICSCSSSVQIADLPDRDSFRETIVLERQHEFLYEGHRWFGPVQVGGTKNAMKTKGREIQGYQFLYLILKTEPERVNNERFLW